MPLSVTADLRLDIDGVTASVTTVDGDLVVDCDQPAALVAHLRAAGGHVPDVSGRLAGLPMGLAPGTRLVLRGTSGEIASAHLADGRTFRARNVRVRRPQDLASPSQRRLAASVLVTLLLLLLLRALRGRRTRDQV